MVYQILYDQYMKELENYSLEELQNIAGSKRDHKIGSMYYSLYPCRATKLKVARDLIAQMNKEDNC